MESLSERGATKAPLLLVEEYCSKIKTVQINTPINKPFNDPRKGNL
jgi:hypothetical protein